MRVEWRLPDSASTARNKRDATNGSCAWGIESGLLRRAREVSGYSWHKTRLWAALSCRASDIYLACVRLNAFLTPALDLLDNREELRGERAMHWASDLRAPKELHDGGGRLHHGPGVSIRSFSVDSRLPHSFITMADNTHTNGVSGTDQQPANAAARRPYDYGGNPLAREETNESARLAAFGGGLQPGLYKQVKSNIANPAPLGLCAFALTTFLLSLINMGTRGVATPNIVVSAAFGYGGLVQLLAGMWEMAVGNTFGATALSSYGGFWISFAIIFTPGGFSIEEAYSADMTEFYDVFGFYLMGWFIFTFLMLLCTLRSTLAFFLLFFFLDMAFLLLGITYLVRVDGMPNTKIEKAGGVFACLSAFTAWYNALAGILDRSNSFFLIPVLHFPWSEKGREARGKPLAADKEAQD
ncbi:hypothetical protein FH972_020994 [Carpinus fangiana]|uniref:GPR1/FUN34/yaaH family protein n=1 Tax=Carpinus fangiana TaxID=176857 RepID=A0A5N6KNF0_9ROSI|nr:hypothetical protein FH972_020994 [Carpinus fangiana]